MHVAARETSLEVAQCLLALTDANVDQTLLHRNAEGRTPLECVSKDKSSATAQRAKAMRRLLDERTKRATKAAMVAAASGGAAKGAAPKEVGPRASPKKAATGPVVEVPSSPKLGTARAGAASNRPKATPSGDAAPVAAAEACEAAPVDVQAALQLLQKRLTTSAISSIHSSLSTALAKPRATPEPAAAASAKVEATSTAHESTPAEAVPSAPSANARAESGPAQSARADTRPPLDEPASAGEARPHEPLPPHPAVPEAAPPSARAVHDFEGCPWRVVIVRSAAKQLAALGGDDCDAALSKLQTLAEGYWQDCTVAKKLRSHVARSTLSLYETKFLKGARIIWEVGVDFSPREAMCAAPFHLPPACSSAGGPVPSRPLLAILGVCAHDRYCQTIRVWAVERRHDDAQKAIQYVINVYRRGLESVTRRRLHAPRVHRAHGSELTLPRQYTPAEGDELGYAHTTCESLESVEELEEAAAAAAVAEGGDGVADEADAAGGEHTRYPPAVAQENAFNLVKFYGLERSLAHAMLSQVRAAARVPTAPPATAPSRHKAPP